MKFFIALLITPLLLASLMASTQDSAQPVIRYTSEKTAIALAEAIEEAKVLNGYEEIVGPEEQTPETYIFDNQVQEVIRVLELPSDIEIESRYNEISPRVYSALSQGDFFDLYDIDFSMSPYFQRGDFNDDGDFDIAILIIGKITGERGFVLMGNDDFSYKVIASSNNYSEVLGD